MDNRPIGIMDSGIGGLTVARVLHENYPQEGIVFLGDTARNPYGERSREEITRFSEAIRSFLLSKQVKMILIACNTISFNVPPSFFDCPIPVVKMSMDVTLPENAKKVGVFATPATIATHVHKAYLSQKYPQIEVVEIPCDGLAAAIEQNAEENIISGLVERAVMEYHALGVDTALWSCTHYPLVQRVFQKVLPHVHFLDPAFPTVETGMDVLRKADGLAGEAGEKVFYFTDGLDHAMPVVQRLFGDVSVEKTNLVGV